MASPGECYYNTVLCRNYFSSASVVSRTFSALCVYSKCGHHPHTQATFVPNLVSFVTSFAEQAHGEKLRTQSLSSSLFDAPGIEALALWNK